MTTISSIPSFPSFRDQAVAFQAAQDSSDTASAQAYGKAQDVLKGYAGAVKDYRSFIELVIADPAAKEKAVRKFAEWEREAPTEIKTYNIFYFMADLYRFAENFLTTTQDRLVTDARLLKKIVKLETFKAFEKGATVEQLQTELTGLNEKTIGKVAHWFQSYHDLKNSGGLEAKMESLSKKITAE